MSVTWEAWNRAVSDATPPAHASVSSPIWSLHRGGGGGGWHLRLVVNGHTRSVALKGASESEAKAEANTIVRWYIKNPTATKSYSKSRGLGYYSVQNVMPHIVEVLRKYGRPMTGREVQSSVHVGSREAKQLALQVMAESRLIKRTGVGVGRHPWYYSV